MGLKLATLTLLYLFVATPCLAIPLTTATLNTVINAVVNSSSSRTLLVPTQSLSVLNSNVVTRSALWTLPVPSQLSLADGVSLIPSEGYWGSTMPPSTCSSDEVATMTSVILRGEPHNKASKDVPEYAAKAVKNCLLTALNELGAYTVYSKALPFSEVALTVAVDINSAANIATQDAAQIKSLINDMDVFLDGAVWSVIGALHIRKMFWVQQCVSNTDKTKQQQENRVETRDEIPDDVNAKLEAGKHVNEEDLKQCLKVWEPENVMLWKLYYYKHCDSFIADKSRPDFKRCRACITKLKASNARYDECLANYGMGLGH